MQIWLKTAESASLAKMERFEDMIGELQGEKQLFLTEKEELETTLQELRDKLAEFEQQFEQEKFEMESKLNDKDGEIERLTQELEYIKNLPPPEPEKIQLTEEEMLDMVENHELTKALRENLERATSELEEQQDLRRQFENQKNKLQDEVDELNAQVADLKAQLSDQSAMRELKEKLEAYWDSCGTFGVLVARSGYVRPQISIEVPRPDFVKL